MSKDLRWRIVVLQVALILIFAFGAGIGAWAHNFTHDQVAIQLSGQQIVFPIALYACIGLIAAAVMALHSLLFKIFVAPKRLAVLPLLAAAA